MLSDEHDDMSRSAGFMSEKKSRAYSNARRWSRHICAYLYTCVRACEGIYDTHGCTCELAIERTRFSVSHRGLFPHVVLRHGTLFCSFSRPTLPRPNPYHRPLHILLASLFHSLVIPFRLPRTSNRCVTVWFIVYDIIGFT